MAKGGMNILVHEPSNEAVRTIYNDLYWLSRGWYRYIRIAGSDDDVGRVEAWVDVL